MTEPSATLDPAAVPAGGDWPPHGTERRAWRQSVVRGPRADRAVRFVDARIPPRIAEQAYEPTRGLRTQLATATDGLVRLDQVHGRNLGALSQLLLRTESIASSKIENIEASLSDYGKALMGQRANASAVSMAAATEALSGIIVTASSDGRITRDAVLRAHHALFRSHPDLASKAGTVRTAQNWIGGSDYSPRNALFVPPPPETVVEHLDDLFAFANRDDVLPLAQAAIVHAQFESIHPFVDGNGRIGRTLIHAVLRRRGVTRRLTVPIASGLTAHRERYFEALGDYRRGDAATIIALLASATMWATHEARRTVTNLQLIHDDWDEALGQPADGAPDSRVLRFLMAEPIITTSRVAEVLGLDDDATAALLERLRRADVLAPLTARGRDRVWGAHLVLDEVRDLSARIERLSLRDAGDAVDGPVWARPWMGH
ncbi:Fic family protein [Nocardioides zeae]|uniref:Fic family protein n=1 Tax=Nocardioides imazamoxiresistens TaxID=3231893 RepID=A0ABU3PXX4_9ACTN|nr:Fic family protein [Nocardioides zeae]MDT9593736.1 Fic family protein [Nocardioides zeae]